MTLSQARIDGKVQYWHMFGLEVEQAGYQAMVIPVLVVAWILAWVESASTRFSRAPQTSCSPRC